MHGHGRDAEKHVRQHCMRAEGSAACCGAYWIVAAESPGVARRGGTAERTGPLWALYGSGHGSGQGDRGCGDEVVLES
eukprot:2673363-Amphidinium_carterae.2